MAAMYKEYRKELCDWREFPLYSELTVPQGGAAYQKCKTGTRFWRAEVAQSVDDEWRVYVWVYGPRGTEQGWAGCGLAEVRRGTAWLDGIMHGFSAQGLLWLAPWYAAVKGEDHHYTLTDDEARLLRWRLWRLAGELEEQERLASLAPYDVPGLPEGVPA